MQAVWSVPFFAGYQGDQGFPVGVHDVVDLAEGGSVLEPQFRGAFVEPPVA